MGIVDSILERQQALSLQRAPWARAWDELALYCLPMAERMRPGGAGAFASAVAAGPNSMERARHVYDGTSLSALDRLASGMESLVTPQAEKWHGLGLNDPFRPEPTDEEVEWFERLRDYQFAVRYDPRSGFVSSHQKALRNMVALGTAVVFVEEAFGARGAASARDLPILYRHVPLTQNFLAIDAQGNPDTNYRRFAMTPRQMVQRFGERVGDKIRAMAEHDRDKDRHIEIIHAVMPREEMGSLSNSNRSSPFASYYIELEGRTLLGESGFFEFPYIVYYWQQSDEAPYGESPAMLALADIKTLNAMAQTALRSAQQMIAPPLATVSDGVMNRPNLNANAINHGALDDNGNLKIKPIITAQAPTFAEAVMQQKREAVKDCLYINLFQTLIESRQMTATQSLIRANEKGELLGPAGAKIQHAMSLTSDRELGILERKGVYHEGSLLAPPASLAGRPFKTVFTSPLDRLRRNKELIGITQTFDVISPLAAVDPGVLDNFDGDEIVRLAADISGVPRKALRQRGEVDEMRQQRAEAAARAADAEQLKREGEAAQAALPAVGAINELLGGPQVPAGR